MGWQHHKRVVRAGALGTLSAVAIVASLSGAPLAGAAGAVGAAGAAGAAARLPSCSWPVSKVQIDTALGVQVMNPAAPMTESLGVAGGTTRFTMCIYYGVGYKPVGDVVLEYFGGVGTAQAFGALERGVIQSKHLGHMTVVHGIGSEAFYATASAQTYLIAHVGTTMFLVFAMRPPAKVIGLARTIGRAL